MPDLPFPPIELANRSGRVIGEDGSFMAYEHVGRTMHDAVGGYEGSISWRLTAPIRSVGRALERPRRHSA